MTGVAEGPGVGVAVGDVEGVGDAVAVGVGLGVAAEYCIASQLPVPLSVYVVPDTTPLESMLVKTPAVTAGAVQAVTPTAVGLADGDGLAVDDEGVGDGADEDLGMFVPVPPEVLHCASATLHTHSAANPDEKAFGRRRRGAAGCTSIAGIAVSVRRADCWPLAVSPSGRCYGTNSIVLATVTPLWQR